MLSKNELRALYGQQYVDAFEQKQSRYRLERLIDAMDLRPTDKAADIACGSGIMLPLVTGKVGDYVGVDFSEEFIAAARDKMQRLSIPNAAFVCSDIVEFCAAHPQAFDLVFAMDFAEHVYDDEWARILLAVKKALKDGGRLYLHTPNAEFFLERMKAANFLVKQFPEHIAVRSPQAHTALLEACGFHIRAMKLLPHYNALRWLHPLSYLPLIGRRFKARIFIEAVA